ncbi:MAG: hypothetical protein WBR35_11135, partial [Anaerolineae bacterium]
PQTFDLAFPGYLTYNQAIPSFRSLSFGGGILCLLLSPRAGAAGDATVLLGTTTQQRFPGRYANFA